MIVTNLRIPKSDWLQMRALAGEAQMSVNEYVSTIINAVSKARQLSVSVKNVPLKPLKHDPIWDWSKIAKKLKIRPMGLSSDDEAIYG